MMSVVALFVCYYVTASCLQDDALQNNTVDEVWVHPESLVMLDGAVVSNAFSDAQEAPVVVLWSPESKPITNNEQTEASRYELTF